MLLTFGHTGAGAADPLGLLLAGTLQPSFVHSPFRIGASPLGADGIRALSRIDVPSLACDG